MILTVQETEKNHQLVWGCKEKDLSVAAPSFQQFSSVHKPDNLL